MVKHEISPLSFSLACRCCSSYLMFNIVVKNFLFFIKNIFFSVTLGFYFYQWGEIIKNKNTIFFSLFMMKMIYWKKKKSSFHWNNSLHNYRRNTCWYLVVIEISNLHICVEYDFQTVYFLLLKKGHEWWTLSQTGFFHVHCCCYAQRCFRSLESKGNVPPVQMNS